MWPDIAHACFFFILACSSPMPFLDQHFYTDAGVALPPDPVLKASLEVKKLINSAENLTTWLDQISLDDLSKKIELEPADLVVSVENVKPSVNMTDSDVKALEGMSNMTDDVKTTIRTRPKRRSCVFSTELRVTAAASVKRRSLHMTDSKIPVCSRVNKLAVQGKSKSFTNQVDTISNNNQRVLRRSSSSDKVDLRSKAEIKFKRYSATERNFRDSARNNNLGSTVESKLKPVSGLPLALRSKWALLFLSFT